MSPAQMLTIRRKKQKAKKDLAREAKRAKKLRKHDVTVAAADASAKDSS